MVKGGVRQFIMDLIKQYSELITRGNLEPDRSQEIAISELNIVREELLSVKPTQKSNNLLSRLFTGNGKKTMKHNKSGLYLFGGVGSGKSMMMDLFFASINSSKKRRVHFHAFMYEFHENMKKIRQIRKKDPVHTLCKGISKQADLLCFDEFQITDITDAMIVGRLFKEIFSAGMTVITTSNFHPEELYKDGLNRGLFLPFIHLLMDNLKIVEVDNQVDYRNKKLRTEDSYFCEKQVAAEMKFNQIWDEILDNGTEELVIHYQGRELLLKNYVNGACRISFQELCEQPLGAVDYLNLCNHVKVLFLERIPILSKFQNDIARRFILLIDTLYEAKVRLICYAAVEPESLYSNGRFKKDFARTVSRLNEMRGNDWHKKA